MSLLLADLGYAAAWRLLGALPRPAVAPLLAAAARVVCWRSGPGVAQLTANLRRVVGPSVSAPELDALVRAAIRSYARYYFEVFRLPSLSRDDILRRVRLEAGEGVIRDMESGRGTVIALPHSGNWDAAGAWVAAMGWPVVSVAERLKPERLYRRFVAYRSALGVEILPLTGGSTPLRIALESRLRRGYMVALLADRDLAGNGVEVDFFGSRARMPAGPAMLAIRTGAPLYTLDMWYEEDVLVGRARGPLATPDPARGTFSQRVRLLTQTVTDSLAAGIGAHPVDWHMLQPLWELSRR